MKKTVYLYVERDDREQEFCTMEPSALRYKLMNMQQE